jgi:hypothetical protein
MELWGFIKSSEQNKAVHMELSICLSFQLSRSVRGYMVGTTAGFSHMVLPPNPMVVPTITYE